MQILDALEKARFLLRFSQAEFARELGITTGAYCKYVHKKRVPSFSTIRKFESLIKKHKLDLNLDEILAAG